jgi:hypothetical protein
MGKKREFVPFKAHTPTAQTREIASTLAGLGLTKQLIASTLQINYLTLEKYYLLDMEVGRAKTHAKVAKAIVENAVDNMNVAAQQLYAKTQMGWSETSKVEHSGAQMVIAPWLTNRNMAPIDVNARPVSGDNDTDGQQSLDGPDTPSDAISDKPPGRPVIKRRNVKRVLACRANAKLGGAARAAQFKKAAEEARAAQSAGGGDNLHIAPSTKNSDL